MTNFVTLKETIRTRLSENCTKTLINLKRVTNLKVCKDKSNDQLANLNSILNR